MMLDIYFTYCEALAYQFVFAKFNLTSPDLSGIFQAKAMLNTTAL